MEVLLLIGGAIVLATVVGLYLKSISAQAGQRIRTDTHAIVG